MKYLFLILSGIIPVITIAQTSTGKVSSIELKAKQISQYEDQITKLKRQHFDTYAAEKQKLDELQRAVSDMRREKETVMKELRSGRFCNGCSRTATQLRQSGVYNVEEHFRQNGGTRPASPEMIEQKEKYYDAEIAKKEAARKAFELSENEFTRKRTDIDKQIASLMDQIAKLRDDIVKLSREYNDATIKEAKSIGAGHIHPLLRLVAEKHFIEDRINIIDAKIKDLDAEELKALRESDDKVRKRSEEEKNQLEKQLSTINANLSQREISHRNRLQPLKNQASSLSQQLQSVEQKLMQRSRLSEDELRELEAEKKSLESKLSDTRKEIAAEETAYNQEKQKLESDRKNVTDKIYEIPLQLSKKQREASEALKKAFAMRRQILTDGREARKVNLQSTGELLISRKAAARKKFLEYAQTIEKERVRMLTACRTAGCSCYGTGVYNSVVGAWNSMEGCIGQMDNTHYSSSPVMGCVEESPIYKSHYASLINGLSDSDLRSLQQQAGKTRFDLLLQKISN